MKTTATEAKLLEIVADFEAGRTQDWTGLWEIAGAVRRECGLSDNQDVKDHALKTVLILMKRGFRVGQFKRYGARELILWPDQSPDAVVARIDREWDVARGDPDIHEICWFE